MPFHYVSHEIFLSKLTYHVVIGKVKGFFKSYLSDRNQRVQITDTNFNHNTFSKWAKVKHSVPHGSILGPLLFLPYINDSPKVIESKANLFFFCAEGTSILITSPNTTYYKMILT